jgi:hypothetical protein
MIGSDWLSGGRAVAKASVARVISIALIVVGAETAKRRIRSRACFMLHLTRDSMFVGDRRNVAPAMRDARSSIKHRGRSICRFRCRVDPKFDTQ